jgi:hypothetical protein
MGQQHHHASEKGGSYTVRSPRVTDAIGEALQACFSVPRLPADMQHTLLRLDAACPH